jgi:endonuclease/exonuclease/phosphatase family metal-dependent hydrolase
MKYPILSILILSGLVLFSSCEKGALNPTGTDLTAAQGNVPDASGQLTVMTQNVYVGADVDRILTSPPEQIPVIAAELFQQLQATNFPERADALALRIKELHPHLIGLQEISTIRTQIPGDYLENHAVDAGDVMYDYLGILMDALNRQGLSYGVAALVQNADVEVPMIVGMSDEGPEFGDVRLTDYDVILARTDVDVSNAIAANYEYGIDLSDIGIYIPRGYVAVDVKWHGQAYRFVSTHLEDPSGNPDLVDLQLAQVNELTTLFAEETKPIIVVGDFNSPAPDGPAYNFMISAGYQDAWILNQVVSEEPGYTFGHEPDLMDPAGGFTERIDFVFLKNGDNPVSGPVIARVVGVDNDDRTVNGLWPSDHGGLFARLPLPPLFREDKP